jgi:hypothetical protein
MIWVEKSILKTASSNKYSQLLLRSWVLRKIIMLIDLAGTEFRQWHESTSMHHIAGWACWFITMMVSVNLPMTENRISASWTVALMKL